MIDFNVKHNLNIPVKIDLTKVFMRAGQTVAMDMRQGIDSGTDITGHPFPELEATTINKKGHAHPLIDLNILRRSFVVEKKGKNFVIVKIAAKGNPPRNEVGFSLQVEGVEQKTGLRKHFLFFGISKKASRKIWADVIRETTKRLRRK